MGPVPREDTRLPYVPVGAPTSPDPVDRSGVRREVLLEPPRLFVFFLLPPIPRGSWGPVTERGPKVHYGDKPLPGGQAGERDRDSDMCHPSLVPQGCYRVHPCYLRVTTSLLSTVRDGSWYTSSG